jgi:hypothetical protein
VVDADGKPLVVYKGMHPYEGAEPTIGFRERPPDAWPGREITSIDRGTEFPAFHGDEPGVKLAGFFGDKKTAAKFARVFAGSATFPVYLSLQNPYIVDAKGGLAGHVQFGESGKPWRDALRSGVYDGSIIKNTSDEGTIYVALRPEQIKSAISNSGAFDPTDPDILARGKPISVQQTPEEIFQERRTEYLAAAQVSDRAWQAWYNAKHGNFGKPPQSAEETARLDALYKAAVTAKDIAKKAMEDARPARSQMDLFNPDEHLAIKRKRIKAVCEDMAKLFDFPAENLRFSDTPYPFELNGQKFMASGTAHLDTGIITLYPETEEAYVDQTMAHEVGHIRYEAVATARRREIDRFADEPRDSVRHEDLNGNVRMLDFMRPDGTLREGYDAKYPIYTMTEKFNARGMHEKLAKEDGVTAYSRDWWEAYEANTVGWHQAMHETFAEISKLEYYAKKTGGDASLKTLGVGPTWRKLYRAYQKAYKGIAKAQKKAAKP